jgi:plastocyanin
MLLLSPVVRFARRTAIVCTCLAALASTATSTSSVTAQDATLKMRFVYEGTPPEVKNIDPNKDLEFCGKHDIPNERLVINPENKGIQNVIVHVYSRSSGKDLPKTTPPSATHVLANDKCRFEPHIVIAQAGDTLKITNPDPVGHNANISFFKNTAVNLMIPAGQEKEVKIKEEEPAPIPVECNIHPWMRAYVVVLDHPFAAVSNADGELVIEGLPAGKEIEFAVRYDGGKLEDVTVGGKKTSWKRQRFEVDLKAGENDLGDVLVPGDSLSAE